MTKFLQFETNEPRVGIWKLRFSLIPVIIGRRSGSYIREWMRFYRQMNLLEHKVIKGRRHFQRKSVSHFNQDMNPYFEDSAE